MGKICRTFRTSSIVDAFAGPGRYSDGPDGSPIIIAKTYLEHSSQANFNTLNLICLEERQDRYDHLRSCLSQLPPLPRLRTQALYGRAADSLDRLTAAARPPGSPDAPVLWILDPFGYGDVPFELVRACLSRPRAEVLVTWFADEIHRFCEDSSKAAVFSRHFGGEHWRRALTHTRESDRKQALLAAYEEGLRQLPDIHTGSISISNRNETARYSLVFATHSDKGLDCFNHVRWKLDPLRGAIINEHRGPDQTDLFANLPMVSPLRHHLETYAGQAVPFTQLASDAARLGFKETHLRQVLDQLADDAQAAREEPLEARSTWPGNSKIRFYNATGPA
jgi:three-Cys-motif partner protein